MSNWGCHWLRRVLRRKRLGPVEQLHSEWDRRLGICSVTAIASTLSLALSLHIILPGLFSEYWNKQRQLMAVPLVPLALSSLLVLLSAQQLASIGRRIAKDGLLYQLAYVTAGEGIAFWLGWSQLLDQVGLISLAAHALSEHTNLLFRNAVKQHLRLVSTAVTISNGSLSTAAQWSSISHHHPQIDLFAILLPLLSGLVLLCSLRVLITVTVVFLVAALFTSASTTTVAFMHNLGHLRINELSLFSSPEQMFTEGRWFLLGFLLLEALSFLPEECTQPRTLPCLIRCAAKGQFAVLLLGLLAFFPFVSRLPLGSLSSGLPLPAFFNSIRLFSAQYLMNVGSVCLLWAALICLFLAPTRLIVSLGHDRLLPVGRKWLVHLAKKGGQPRFAAIVVQIISSLAIAFVPKAWFCQIMPLNITIRMAVQAVIIYLAHFTPSSSDKFMQTCPHKYQRIRRKIMDESQDEEDDISLDEWSDDDSEREDSDWARHMQQREHLMERIWRMASQPVPENGQHCEGQQQMPTEKTLLSGKKKGKCHCYSSMDSVKPVQSAHDGQILPAPHNCLRSSCLSAPVFQHQGQNPVHHIYEGYASTEWGCRESGSQAAAELDEEKGCRRARRALGAFCLFPVLGAFSIGSLVAMSEDHKPVLALFSLAISLAFSIGISLWIYRLRIDWPAEREGRKEAAKALVLGSMVSLFLLIQTFPLFSLKHYFALALWTLFGSILYALSVFRSQRRKRRQSNII